MSTKEAKLTYQQQGEHELNRLTNNDLLNLLLRSKESYPLINNGGELRIEGEIGQSGLVILNNGRFVAAVRSPDFIPSQIDLNQREVCFGGEQTENMIELSLEIPLGKEAAAQVASMVLIDLRRGFEPSLVSMANSGFAAIGSEPEAWLIDPNTGDLVDVSAGELQAGLLEETLPPIFNPREFLRERAKYNLERVGKHPGCYILDTSVLPTSDPLKPQVNTGHDLGPYVYAIQSLLREKAFNESDQLTEMILQQIINRYGFTSHSELKIAKGDMAYWVMAASHASVGLPHLRRRASEFFVPAEIAIAVSDIFNSDLATIAEFLMFSSPMIFGVSQVEVDGKKIWPRDYRAILRYLMDTTNPAPFIESYEEMVKRITYGIVNGLTHTADRSSYIADINGRSVAVMHGRVRNRICSSEPKNQTGRVEFTGCGASPSLYDEVARNCFLQIMAVASLEAVENGQTPMEYWGENYPHIASWENQKRLLQKASLEGFRVTEIRQLIQEGLAFIEDVLERYPSLQEIGQIASERIQNLLEEPIDSLEEYINNPKGPISEVIQKEIARGLSSLELVKKIHDFQLELSQKILNDYENPNP